MKSFSFSTDFLAFLEHLSNFSDTRYSEVHAELIIDKCAYTAVANSGKDASSCVVKYRFGQVQPFPFLEFVDIPVKNLQRARQIAEEIHAKTRATYEIPFFDLAIPSYFVHDIGTDPAHWDHLYCSQFVLLFLRICAQKDILDLPRSKLECLDESHCNSVRCTPAHLRHVLRNMLGR